MSVPIGPTHNVSGTVNVIQSGSYNITPFASPSAFVFSKEGKQFSMSFKDGRLVIESDMDLDDSAKQFFEYFKMHVESYIKEIMSHDNLKYLEWCANEGKKHE